MSFLTAKDVRNLEFNFYELLYRASGKIENKQAFFRETMKIRVPKTSYEIMWDRLVEKLERKGAGEAVFDYILHTASPRLRSLLQDASRGPVSNLTERDLDRFGLLFFRKGKLRRIGQLLVGYAMAAKVREQRAGKETTDRPGLPPLEYPTTVSGVEQFQYDVALSYASEQREYVTQVYHALVEMGIKTFYDMAEESTLWGKDLVAYLDSVFRIMARFCVVFVSREYVSKPWPRLEAQRALARAVSEKGEYILPVRFDRTPLPGLLVTVKYLNAEGHTPTQLAGMIQRKLMEAN